MSPDRKEVRLGGVPLKVPVVVDPETTDAIVSYVNDRFRQIETQGGKINTQLYALLTAYQFAVELHMLRRQQEAEDTSLLHALEKLDASLQTILAEIEAPKD